MIKNFYRKDPILLEFYRIPEPVIQISNLVKSYIENKLDMGV
jgi:hypothetical protein